MGQALNKLTMTKGGLHMTALGGKGDYFREIFRKCYKNSRMSY